MAEARIYPLDGLRGLACLIVTVLHCLLITVPDDRGTLADLIVGIPKIGVWLFFSLSAFLLTLNLCAPSGSNEPIARYFTKRLFRIAPAFVVALFFYVVTGVVPFTAWWQTLYGQEAANLLHLWTIPVEVSFYCVLPAILLACSTCRQYLGRRYAIAPVLLTAALCAIFWPPDASPPGSLWVGWYAINFLSGIAAALLCQNASQDKPRFYKWLGAAAFALIVGIVLATKAGLVGTGRSWLVDKHYLFGPLWSVVIYATYKGANTLMSCSPLVMIGRWSYSIYLFHWLAALAAAKTLPPALAFPSALAASILAGFAGWWAIEQPSYKARGLFRRTRSMSLPDGNI